MNILFIQPLCPQKRTAERCCLVVHSSTTVASLSSAPDGSVWWASHPGRFGSREILPDTRGCAPEPVWTPWRGKNQFPLRGIKLWFKDCPARTSNLVSVPTEIFQLLICWSVDCRFSDYLSILFQHQTNEKRTFWWIVNRKWSEELLKEMKIPEHYCIEQVGWTGDICFFLRALQVNAGKEPVLEITPRSFPSKSFPIHYLVIILYSIQCGNHGASLSVSDVQCYVIIRKSVHPIFNILPVSIHRWEIQT
jgi:hypothetical protein